MRPSFTLAASACLTPSTSRAPLIFTKAASVWALNCSHSSLDFLPGMGPTLLPGLLQLLEDVEARLLELGQLLGQRDQLLGLGHVGEALPVLALAQLAGADHQLAADLVVARDVLLAGLGGAAGGLAERGAGLLEQAVDGAGVVALDQADHLVDQGLEAARDLGAALGALLALDLDLGGIRRLGRTAGVVLGAAGVALGAAGRVLAVAGGALLVVLGELALHDRHGGVVDDVAVAVVLALALALFLALLGLVLERLGRLAAGAGGAGQGVLVVMGLAIGDLAAGVVARHRLGEALVEGGVVGVTDLGPRLLGGGHGGERLHPLEHLGDALDLAHQLRLLGAAAAELVGLLGPLGLFGLDQLVDLLAGALAHRLVLGLLGHVLEVVLGAEAVDREQPQLLDRGVDGEAA